MFETLIDQGCKLEDVLRAWPESPPAHVRYISPVVPKLLPDWYTVVTTSSGTNVHAAAWTGDVPLLLNGSHTDFLAIELERLAKTAVRRSPW